MTKRKVISIIGMVLMLFLIGNLFLPFISGGGQTFSFWEFLDNQNVLEVAIILIFLLTFGFLTFLCQLCGLIDQAKFVYFPLGYYVTYHVTVLINLIQNDLVSLSDKNFEIIEKPIIYNDFDGKILNLNNIVKDCGLKKGCRLLLR